MAGPAELQGSACKKVYFFIFLNYLIFWNGPDGKNQIFLYGPILFFYSFHSLSFPAR